MHENMTYKLYTYFFTNTITLYLTLKSRASTYNI